MASSFADARIASSAPCGSRDGARGIARRVPVSGQCEDVFLGVPGLIVRGLGCGPVQPRSFVGEHGPVDGLLDEHMLEPVLGLWPASLRDHEAESLQVVERLLQGLSGAHQVGQDARGRTGVRPPRRR